MEVRFPWPCITGSAIWRWANKFWKSSLNWIWVSILKPSLFHLSIVEEINKFSNKLCFILSEECNENFYSGMTELI